MNADDRLPPASAEVEKTVANLETSYEVALRGSTSRPADDETRADLKSGAPPQQAGRELLGLLGDYELLEVLGKGGMGIVYRARQRRANRIVALKVVRGDAADESETIARFKAEAQAAARLDHPNLVTVYEVGFVDGRHFFSMRYVEGNSLADLLKDGPLENRRAAQYLEPVARALQEAHTHGVLHRDLKPGNILIETRTDRALVADFGLAKLQETGDSHTRAGEVFGSPPYMSPEQTLDSATVTPAADIYSLGATLYHALTGRPPFQATSIQGTLRLVLESDPVKPRLVNKSVDRDLETICLKCLEKEPGRRYASAAELGDELARYLRNEPIKARPLGTLERAARWCRRKPILVGLCGASLVALVAVGIALLLAYQVRQAGAAALRAQELAARLDRFEKALDRRELDPAFLQRGEQLASDIRELDIAKGSEAKGRVRRAYRETILEALAGPKLHDSDFERITAAISALAPLDAAGSAELTERVQRRRRRWQDLFDVRAPFASLPEVFIGDGVAVREEALANMSSGATVLTSISAGEHVEVEMFLATWEDAAEVGIVFAPPPGKGRAGTGHELVLKTRVPAPNRPPPTFAQARARGDDFQLEIRRGAVVIAREWIKPALMPAGPLRLRARREGQRLTLQANARPPLVAEELFLTSGRNAEAVGFAWPAGVTVERLRFARQSGAAQASLLERGDELFGSGDIVGALEQYVEQAKHAKSPAFQQEARFKQAICLAELKRLPEAEQLFERVAAESGPRWPLLATAQAWLLKVQENKYAEADALLESVSARFRFKELAAQIPADVREQIIKHYERALGTGYQTIRRDPARVRNMERLVAVAALLEGDADRVLNARFSLAHAYLRDERLKEALGQLEALLAGEDLSDVGRYEVLQLLVWTHLNLRQPREALAIIDTTLKSKEGRVPNALMPLLVDRARVYAALAEWEAADRDVDNYLKVSSPRSSGFIEGCLARGFIRRQLGDEAGARDAWQQGFRAAREQDALNVIQGAILGSLSGELSRADVDRMVSKVTAGASDSPVMSFMSKRLVPEELVFSAARNMWQTPRGLEYARRIALHQSTYHESFYIQVLLTANEFWRQCVTGSTDPTVLMSREQDDLVWKMTEEMYAAYLEGTFTELHLIPIGLTFKGSTNFVGWAGVAASLKPNLRGPLAYIFGRQYKHAQKTPEARMFFETALRDAAPDSPLAKLAQAELDELRAAAEAPSSTKP